MSGHHDNARHVYFFVNGLPRLIIASALAGDSYPKHKKHLILLNQFGYRYDSLLSQVSGLFESVSYIDINQRKYSHVDQFYRTYIKSPRGYVQDILPGSDLVMFGFRSPIQKHLLNYVKNHGGKVDIYAESLSTDKYFSDRSDDGFSKHVLRKTFAKAFDYQHNYDRFFVYFPQRYKLSRGDEKLFQMPDIYASDQFQQLADTMLAAAPEIMPLLAEFDECFFGQPLSNFDNLIGKEQEMSLLGQIIGDKKVLILPHPNEVLGPGDKYSALPNAHVLNSAVPNDFILAKWRPQETSTYGSTIGLMNALHNPVSVNYFYPVFGSQAHELQQFKRYLPQIKISEDFVIRQRQY